jgi:DmsE family decaheme c-type cytochrome
MDWKVPSLGEAILRTTKLCRRWLFDCPHGTALGGLLLLVLASCHSQYQPNARSELNLDPGWPKAHRKFHAAEVAPVRAQRPTIPGAEYVYEDEDNCGDCHRAYVKVFLASNVHRNVGCEACHGPGSKHAEDGELPVIVSFKDKTKPPAVLAEICLRCHEENACTEGAHWRTSKHAAGGVSCTACHRAHYDVPPGTPTSNKSGTASTRPFASRIRQASDQPIDYQTPKPKLPSLRGSSNHMGATLTTDCYRCHADKIELEQIAGPHQIGSRTGLTCVTCHDPHGNVKEFARKDLCLSCHQGSPTMAWHSSTHERYDVACTDCHNPHPRKEVPQVVNVSHTHVERPKRMPMAVQEPEACYKCHQKTFALGELPSHHPVREGKMVCSDCHDPHGQLEGNLKAETINLLCYKCHAEKQGPFAYPHTPVTENCGICHEPHGTVANNLLRQPAMFLCLRCHTGHRNNAHFPDIDTNPAGRAAFFTDCTNCHTQIHGSDVPAPSSPNARILTR